MAWVIESSLQPQSQLNLLMIATPTRDAKVSMKWHKSNKEMIYPQGWRISEAGEVGQPIDISRNLMLTKALIDGAKFILFWDADVLAPPDSVQQLMTLRLPVVGALLRSRGPPHPFLANINDMPIPEQIIQQPPGIMEVDEIAMGFTLIDMRAIKRYAAKLDRWQCLKNHKNEIGRPVAVFDNANAVKLNFQCQYCKGFLHSKFFDYRAGKTMDMAISEDYFFCRNLREKTGLKSYVCTAVKATHESTFDEVHADRPILVSSLSSAADVN